MKWLYLKGWITVGEKKPKKAEKKSKKENSDSGGMD